MLVGFLAVVAVAAGKTARKLLFNLSLQKAKFMVALGTCVAAVAKDQRHGILYPNNKAVWVARSAAQYEYEYQVSNTFIEILFVKPTLSKKHVYLKCCQVQQTNESSLTNHHWTSKRKRYEIS